MTASTSDPTFYRSPGEAAAAPAEELAYVATFDRAGVCPTRSPWSTSTPARPATAPVGWSEVARGVHSLYAAHSCSARCSVIGAPANATSTSALSPIAWASSPSHRAAS